MVKETLEEFRESAMRHIKEMEALGQTRGYIALCQDCQKVVTESKCPANDRHKLFLYMNSISWLRTRLLITEKELNQYTVDRKVIRKPEIST